MTCSKVRIGLSSEVQNVLTRQYALVVRSGAYDSGVQPCVRNVALRWPLRGIPSSKQCASLRCAFHLPSRLSSARQGKPQSLGADAPHRAEPVTSPCLCAKPQCRAACCRVSGSTISASPIVNCSQLIPADVSAVKYIIEPTQLFPVRNAR
jgi:hypothetical protein